MTNTANNAAAGKYADLLKSWAPKFMGSKPDLTLLETAHFFGRPGKQSLALAMAMRPEGVTAGQIIMACDRPQNNHRKALIQAGHFKREAVPNNELGQTVYKITLTPRGEAFAKRRAELLATAEASPDAPKAAKAKKGKGATKGNAKGARKPKAKPGVATPADVAGLIERTTEAPTLPTSTSNVSDPEQGSAQAQT